MTFHLTSRSPDKSIHEIQAFSVPATYAVVGMAACLGSICNVPVTSVVLLLELAGGKDYGVVLPTVAATGEMLWQKSCELGMVKMYKSACRISPYNIPTPCRKPFLPINGMNGTVFFICCYFSTCLKSISLFYGLFIWGVFCFWWGVILGGLVRSCLFGMLINAVSFSRWLLPKVQNLPYVPPAIHRRINAETYIERIETQRKDV